MSPFRDIIIKFGFCELFPNSKYGHLYRSDKTYIIGEKLELILKMLTFKIINIISHFTKYRQDFLEKEVYTYLPDIRKLGINNIEENKFYKLVGFTENEIKLITN